MATALELTRKGWQHYLESARRRSEPPAPSASVQEKRERLLILVRDAAAKLKDRFGARRVILIGSLAQEADLSPRSDVDLAVEGLAGDDYWEAWRMVEDTITDRPVDLIDIETAGESMLQTIERYGIEL
ncbi:MAG: nucleotidyltransferase domain-containing protein [Syntrophobacteraceae bacterium]